jgi:hypothetical protein
MVVFLMGIIYAGLISGIQERLLYIPEIISRNIIRKQAENVSDYALRLAIQNGDYLRTLFLAQDDTTSHVFIYKDGNEFLIQDSKIDSIKFVFQGRTGAGDHIIKRYLATSYVSGELLGQSVNYEAKLAYEFSANKEFNNIYHNHYTMDEKCWKNLLIDESGNLNNAVLVGKNLNSKKNGPAVGDACAAFGQKGHDDYAYMYYDETQVRVAETFTLSSWIKIPSELENSRGTIAWLPAWNQAGNYTGPYKGNAYHIRPTGAIYYENNKIYFEANTSDGQTLLLSTPISITQRLHQLHKANWDLVAMTYNRGTMKAYKNGELVGTVVADNAPIEAVENWGMYLGSEPNNTGRKNQFEGWMDDLGFSPYVLDSEQLGIYYTTIATPPKILYFRD